MQLKVNFLDAGYCTHPECVTLKGGRYANKIFPAMFIHIEHPKFGHILYDTGYSKRFSEETKSYPNRIYAKLTPVFAKSEDYALNKLKMMGVEPEDVSYIIISHFHADHIGGIADFPKAKYIYLKDDFDKIKHLRGIPALMNGFLPGLLPTDFHERSIAIDDHYKTKNFHSHIESLFDYSYDILGDGSLIAVDLPGHTSAQLGLYLRGTDQEYLLVADSCWMSESIRENIGPSRLSHLIHKDSKKFYETLSKLHRLHHESPEIEQIPSHCGEKFKKHVTHCQWDMNNLNGL